MDDMQVTTEFAPNGTGNYFSFGDLACWFNLQQETDTRNSAFGSTIRYVEETMDVVKMRGV
jgi:hypothetical protein